MYKDTQGAAARIPMPKIVMPSAANTISPSLTAVTNEKSCCVPGHPRSRLFPLEDAEFQGAAAGNTAEYCREFIVIFKFQPIHQIVFGGAPMHQLQQRFTISIAQHVRPEAFPKGARGEAHAAAQGEFMQLPVDRLAMEEFVHHQIGDGAHLQQTFGDQFRRRRRRAHDRGRAGTGPLILLPLVDHAPDGDLPVDGGGVFRARRGIRRAAGRAAARRLGQGVEHRAGR